CSEEENAAKIELLKRMKNIGFNCVFVGFESGSDSQLKRYNKGVSRKENMKAIRILKQIGIHADGGFITFDPLMQMEEVFENTQFLRECDAPKLLLFPFSRLIVFPNTLYYFMHEKKRHRTSRTVARLFQVLDRVEERLPYKLLELFLQKLRLYYFQDSNKRQIDRYELILREYGVLCLNCIDQITEMLSADSDDRSVEADVDDFLDIHRKFCRRFELCVEEPEENFYGSSFVHGITFDASYEVAQ
ncbi:MAG: hypothetical protein OEU26_20780, partial [Candidatus Tectomicrobia bacterium]|nr:hypothetical protein [Candidatus Tectomicrobia bacterium]